ncbi:hypothetical protein METHPM2_80062 [Pseudomonas sp. PM2]
MLPRHNKSVDGFALVKPLTDGYNLSPSQSDTPAHWRCECCLCRCKSFARKSLVLSVSRHRLGWWH